MISQKSQSFKKWSEQYLLCDTPYGDIARDVHNYKACPIFKYKYQTINFIISTNQWNGSAVNCLSEMLDKFYDEVLKYNSYYADWYKCRENECSAAIFSKTP